MGKLRKGLGTAWRVGRGIPRNAVVGAAVGAGVGSQASNIADAHREARRDVIDNARSHIDGQISVHNERRNGIEPSAVRKGLDWLRGKKSLTPAEEKELRRLEQTVAELEEKKKRLEAGDIGVRKELMATWNTPDKYTFSIRGTGAAGKGAVAGAVAGPVAIPLAGWGLGALFGALWRRVTGRGKKRKGRGA